MGGQDPALQVGVPGAGLQVGGTDCDDPTTDGEGDAKKPPKLFQTEIPAEKTKNQCRTVDTKPHVVIAKAGEESKIPVQSQPPANPAKSMVEKVKQPPEKSSKIAKSPLSKKPAKPPEVSKPHNPRL